MNRETRADILGIALGLVASIALFLVGWEWGFRECAGNLAPWFLR